METYLQLTISENPVLVHKRSFSRRDGIALSIRQLDLVGVKCPHYNCLGVIEETKIRSIVDQRTYHKFDQFALDQVALLPPSSSSPPPPNLSPAPGEDDEEQGAPPLPLQLWLLHPG